MAPSLASDSFSALTMIAAPALLTNATCVLALGTINRMLRTRDVMRDLVTRSSATGLADDDKAHLVEQSNRVEEQGEVQLAALRSIYVALGCFSGATLLTLIGSVCLAFSSAAWFSHIATVATIVVALGVGALVLGSVRLFRATRLALNSMRAEAASIRKRLGIEKNPTVG